MTTGTATKRNFILQQGFREAVPDSCPLQYSALQFQPRVVLVWLVAAIVFQSVILFVALCVVLWFSALDPKMNPFDVVYNAIIARTPEALRLGPAPAPRRTAQTMAGAFALACAVLIHFRQMIAAYIIETLFISAVLALTLGGFCLGSFVYHVCRGDTAFARKTLPWAR